MEETIIRIVNDVPDYSWIVNIVSSIVTICVTMLTIYFTNKTTRHQIKSEIENYQRTQLIDYNKEILEDAVQLMRLNDVKGNELDLMKRLMMNIISHGSKETVAILSMFQRENYKNAASGTDIVTNSESYKILAYPALLICQIKYDTMGIVINPKDILKIHIKDYDQNIEFQDTLQESINLIVKKLNLNKNFKC